MTSWDTSNFTSSRGRFWRVWGGHSESWNPSLARTVWSLHSQGRRATLDIRHASDRARTEALDELIRQAESIAARRGVAVKWRMLLAQHAVAMDPFLTEQIEHAVQKAGCEVYRMASGAGHDAMILAEKIPAAMIFLRTPGGISHDPS